MTKIERYNLAIKFVQDAYVDQDSRGKYTIPVLLIGDVAELIGILTGKNVNLEELTLHTNG